MIGPGPQDRDDDANPVVRRVRELITVEAHHDEHVQEDVEQHEALHHVSHTTTALEPAEVQEDEVVFVHSVLKIEVSPGKQTDDWYDGNEQQANEEDDHDIALIVAEVVYEVVVELGLHQGLGLLPLVPPLTVSDLNTVWDVQQRKPVGQEGKLDNELELHVLLCHQVRAKHGRPFLQPRLLEVLEDCGCRRRLGDWDQKHIEEHEEEDAPEAGHLNARLQIVVLERCAPPDQGWYENEVYEDDDDRRKVSRDQVREKRHVAYSRLELLLERRKHIDRVGRRHDHKREEYQQDEQSNLLDRREGLVRSQIRADDVRRRVGLTRTELIRQQGGIVVKRGDSWQSRLEVAIIT